MSEHDFIVYLQGYLEGRQSLSKDEVDFLSAKLKEVKPSWWLDPNTFKVASPVIIGTDQQPYKPINEPYTIPGTKPPPGETWITCSSLPDNHIRGTHGPLAPGPSLEKRYVVGIDKGVEG